MSRQSSFCRLAGLLGLGVLAACGGSSATGVVGGTPAAIVFSTNALTVKQGKSAQVTAHVVDAAGQEIPGAPITFSTSDRALLDIGDNGTVNGVRPGAATLRAMSGSVSADITVDVIGHPEGLRVGSVPLSGRPFGAAVSRQGTAYITRLDAGALGVLDVRSRALVGGISVGAVPTGVAFDPAGTFAYVTNQYDQSLGIIEVAKSAQTKTVPISGDPFVVLVAPDTSRLYVTNNSSSVFVIDAKTHTVTSSIQVGAAPNGFAVHPTAPVVYVSAFVGGTVAEIDMNTNAVLRTFDLGGRPQDLIVSRDGKELFVANEDGWIDVWDLSAGTRITKLSLPGGAFGMALSPDEAHLYTGLPDAGLVQVVNIAARKIIHSIEVGGQPRRIAFDYHGGTAVVANEAGSVDFVR